MRKLLSISLIASAIACAGCGDRDLDGMVSTGPAVAVVYESSPLADVQVRLHTSPTGPIVAQSISAADGTARFSGTPNPEPTEYYVSLASLGDGGWMLDTRYMNPAESGMKLKSLAANHGQRIEVPSGAVRPLHSNNRR